jgi:hypothetical protein
MQGLAHRLLRVAVTIPFNWSLMTRKVGPFPGRKWLVGQGVRAIPPIWAPGARFGGL